MARHAAYGVAQRHPDLRLESAHREALPVENGGIAGRDFIFVEDIARGLIACAVRGEPGEAYNLASGVETTILELAKLINADWQPDADRPGAGARLGPFGAAFRLDRESARKTRLRC